MRIYYVIPPHGVNQYTSQAQAQAAFESGEVWKCVGEAEIVDGKITGVMKYPETTIPARYSECHYHGEGEDTIAVPKAWALQWKPGRVSLMRFKVYHSQRQVTPAWGKGKMVDLVDQRTTDGGEQAYQDRGVTRKKKQALKHELKEHGGWMTGAGLRFRPTFNGEAMHMNRFPMVRWFRSNMTGMPLFDANPACQTLGDRELEKWFASAQHRAYNARAAERSMLKEPDSDDLMDPHVMYFPKMV